MSSFGAGFRKIRPWFWCQKHTVKAIGHCHHHDFEDEQSWINRHGLRRSNTRDEPPMSDHEAGINKCDQSPSAPSCVEDAVNTCVINRVCRKSGRFLNSDPLEAKAVDLKPALLWRKRLITPVSKRPPQQAMAVYRIS